MSAVFDVCVIGSGAGGGAAAYELTRAGYRVVVLEKGPHYRESDFFHDELAVCRRSYFVPNVLDEPHTFARDGAAPTRTSDGWIACCVGGGTVHMSGFFFRLRPDDFRLRARHGGGAHSNIADWPFPYTEIEPYYERVERVIGVSGDAAAEGRRTAYPLGPLLAHPSAALVESACSRVGLRAFPTPRALLSADYAGRAACQYCGFCGSYGCEVGAKSSSLSSFLALAAATGKLTLRPRAHVTRVELDRAGRARGVLYVDEAGSTARVEARVVVVACSAIETARLLLASDEPRHPHGLGNGSGLVGRNLMFSTAASGWGRFARPSPHFPDAARALPFLNRSVRFAAGRSLESGGTVLFNLPHKNPIFQAERLAAGSPPLFGAALKRQLRRFFHETHTVEWESFSEFLPHDGCAVTLDPEVKDRFGRPVARVNLSVHPDSLMASDALARTGRAVLEAAGASELGDRRDERAYLVLQAGTARMGIDPNRSVLDPSGQAHEVRNLYVTDGSGFPSSGGAPFTLSIMANALRVAGRIVERGRRGEL